MFGSFDFTVFRSSLIARADIKKPQIENPWFHYITKRRFAMALRFSKQPLQGPTGRPPNLKTLKRVMRIERCSCFVKWSAD